MCCFPNRQGIALLLLAVGVIITAAGAWPSSSGPGQLVAKDAHVEVKAPDGEKQRVLLSFHNPGSNPVTIRDVKTTCGCTLVERLKASIVGGGESIDVAVSVTPPAIGQKSVSVALLTDSQTSPKVVVQLTVSGPKPQPPLILRTLKEFELVGRLPGEPLETSIRIETWEEAESDPWIVGIWTSDEAIGVSPEAVATTASSIGGVERSYDFVIRTSAPLAAHLTRACSLRIETCRASITDVPILLVRTRLEPALVAVPAEILVTSNTRDPIIEREVVLIGQDDASWQVTNVTCDKPWLDATRTTNAQETGSRVERIAITIHSDRCEPDALLASAVVRISTDHPQIPQVDVPVTLQRIATSDRH